MSSMYLLFPFSSTLLSSMILTHLASHSLIVILATAQVDRRPIGPPAFWRKSFPSKLYTWVPIIVRTPIWTTVATILFFYRVVIESIWHGKAQFSSLSGSEVTPGLTPPLLVLLGNTLYRGDSLCSVLSMQMAVYLRAYINKNVVCYDLM